MGPDPPRSRRTPRPKRCSSCSRGRLGLSDAMIRTDTLRVAPIARTIPAKPGNALANVRALTRACSARLDVDGGVQHSASVTGNPCSEQGDDEADVSVDELVAA